MPRWNTFQTESASVRVPVRAAREPVPERAGVTNIDALLAAGGPAVAAGLGHVAHVGPQRIAQFGLRIPGDKCVGEGVGRTPVTTEVHIAGRGRAHRSVIERRVDGGRAVQPGDVLLAVEAVGGVVDHDLLARELHAAELLATETVRLGAGIADHEEQIVRIGLTHVPAAGFLVRHVVRRGEHVAG